ncbi:MAG TPA: IS21-like element helper ATPase IstB [Myxococcaceae bacterium]|jgi:DNA replication protein DnaC|nr:IS21-like element helper ATPase IstB [Myxococcaceae bacterium]
MVGNLKDRLDALGLPATASGLDDLVSFATKQRFSPVQLLEHVLELEEKERTRRSLERRTARSRLGRFKPMSGFDWSWPTRIDRDGVESALQLEFLPGARNVVFIAAQGLGKTMIAQNIAHHAILAGHSVLFTSTAQMLLDLGAQQSSRALDNRLKHYAKIGLLVLDEVGYIAFDNRNADLLFELVCRRYEQKSLVMTTNLAFRDWPSVFPSATCTTALIDRVIHHADIITIEGDSYRKREAELRSNARRAPSLNDPAKPKKS